MIEYVPAQPRDGYDPDSFVLNVLNSIDLIIIGASNDDTSKLGEFVGFTIHLSLRHLGSQRMCAKLAGNARIETRIGINKVVNAGLILINDVAPKLNRNRLETNRRIKACPSRKCQILRRGIELGHGRFKRTNGQDTHSIDTLLGWPFLYMVRWAF